jgi:iron complex transport system ATP-binding protein
MTTPTMEATPRQGGVLETRDVSVGGGHAWRLRRVSLRVVPGRVHAVLGPNGAGKSTLLGVLAGTLSPDAGSVLLDDQPLGQWGPQRLARQRGILPQESNVSFPLTAREVVALGRLPHKTPRQDPPIVRQAMLRMGVEHLSGRRFQELSGGERQRVQMARVLAQIHERVAPDAAPILLLDEPVSALDLRHQFELFERMRHEALAGCAVLVVLHDLNLAVRYADAVTVLAGGEVAAQGAPAEVLTAELIRRIWGVTAQVMRSQAGAPTHIHVQGPSEPEPVT